MINKKSLRGTTMALALSGVLAFSSSTSYAELGDKTLSKGMNDKDVQILQEELKNLGYFDEEITTYYGENTEKAVRAFQITQQIELNGIFDITTYEALNLLKNKPSSTSGQADVVDLKPEVKPSATSLIFNRELGLKDTGSDVKLLQEALKAMGHLEIDDTTDYFGNQTQEALIAFQSSQGLKADGIAGLRTVEAINTVLTGRSIALPVATRGSDISTKATDIIATGKKYLGAPYVYGASGSKSFDCSGFTTFVFKQHGITLPRATTGQATFGTKVSKSDLQPGDLLIFSNTYKKGPSHAGIYMGNGQFIHASSVGSGGVVISDLNSNYYSNHFSYGRRVL